MTTWRWKYLFPCLILAVPAGLSAQGPRGGFFPWWDSPMVSGLDLTDAQRTQIRSVIREYRGRMLEVRDQVQKAETDLDAVFNEDTVDQRRGAEAIDRLTKARADMTKSVSEMSLRMRAVLTPQQWQELRQRQRGIENVGRGPGSQRGPGRGRRVAKAGPKDGSKSLPASAAEGPSQTPPPALSQQ
ncbi:MAG: Spy/CpxP family protein refolding chaperone [Acidobacteriia bacterium]|nr:Spy/CpxP family protein refolding chaperone [Terriglobia bacterium]